MNWGHKITFAYLGFVIFMVTLVVLCFKQNDIFLVTDNYYEDEIGYQQKITKMDNVKALNEKIEINTNSNSDSLLVDLSKKSIGATGKISFYRPSNQNLIFG